ncbi:MAG TPA: hypothetical protein DDW51_17040 [Cyanobacteria bacterium UBA11367]|nr:hypothetical protein [Cyanobacteria bacterium UBA11367]HBK65521.1 hypothetical protein [Cyanobacteria bacterium UBA11166]HBS70310.1 hypothetical protein [Cyanobacteria bacterium UBA11153]
MPQSARMRGNLAVDPDPPFDDCVVIPMAKSGNKDNPLVWARLPDLTHEADPLSVKLFRSHSIVAPFKTIPWQLRSPHPPLNQSSNQI